MDRRKGIVGLGLNFGNVKSIKYTYKWTGGVVGCSRGRKKCPVE